jgi:RimJ/RimL family protein N-acetyltransferase
VYGIFLTNRLIGIINDTEINGKQIEIGYALNPEFFSNGYMTEALSTLICHLFEEGFEEVVCGAFDHNTASVRVMEKCGMTKIAKTDDIEYRGNIHHCIYYSIRRI